MRKNKNKKPWGGRATLSCSGRQTVRIPGISVRVFLLTPTARRFLLFFFSFVAPYWTVTISAGSIPSFPPFRQSSWTKPKFSSFPSHFCGAFWAPPFSPFCLVIRSRCVCSILHLSVHFFIISMKEESSNVFQNRFFLFDRVQTVARKKKKTNVRVASRSILLKMNNNFKYLSTGEALTSWLSLFCLFLFFFSSFTIYNRFVFIILYRISYVLVATVMFLSALTSRKIRTGNE